MSIEPDDLLEEALRGDLPSPAAAARVRHRLLAAGVAVGNGVAATAAAAPVAGAAAKVTGLSLSWSLKLGVAALVGIPTVGLWLDRGEEKPVVSPPVLVATIAHPAETHPPQAVEATPNAPSSAGKSAEPPEVAPAPRLSGRALADDQPSRASSLPTLAHPSRANFSETEQPGPSPQISTLADETRLLDAAFAELAGAHWARAGALLHEHERRFPRGLLQKERERAKNKLAELSPYK